MRPDPILDAISEQSQQLSAEPGIDKGVKGKGLTSAQKWQPRRSTETILNDMVEKLRPYQQQCQPTKLKRKKRRRRRGPRVYVYNVE